MFCQLRPQTVAALVPLAGVATLAAPQTAMGLGKMRQALRAGATDTSLLASVEARPAPSRHLAVEPLWKAIGEWAQGVAIEGFQLSSEKRHPWTLEATVAPAREVQRWSTALVALQSGSSDCGDAAVVFRAWSLVVRWDRA